LLEYIKRHKNIKDLLITGGDAMVASAEVLSRYIDPLLNNPDTSHLQTIRFGTKSLAYWPTTFTTDDDATAKLALFKKIEDSGKSVSIQAHFTLPVELKTNVVKEAIRNIQATGAIIRTQSPIIRGINDSAECWAEMWNLQTRLGLVPYYA
jgi:L-lysine 2,3-aminomutase